VAHNNSFRGKLWEEVYRILRRILVVTYLGYWSFKSDLRHKYLKRGAFVFVSVPTVFLAFEVLGEIFRPKLVHAIALHMSALVKSHPVLAGLAISPFIGAVAFLIWHNFHEAMSPGYEYIFARRLCEYIATCLKTADRSREARLHHALVLFHSVFRRTRIAHVSIHSPDKGVLVIRREHVFPSEDDPKYFVKLLKGEGVGGKVFEDSNVRYVPRVYFPFARKVEVQIGRKKPVPLSISFPHGIRFDYKTDATNGSGIMGLEFIEEEPEVNVFKPSDSDAIPFRAFLSVPIKESDKKECKAVLNFDFHKADPLNKSDITMAAVFGLLLFDLLHEGA
jgi:hypothetical protein